MSDRSVAVSPRACSGLMYWTEPRVIPGRVIWASAIARAIPKSVTSTRPSWASMMLPGLMSRWTIPRAWAAASARATSAAIRADWAGGSGPVRRRSVARSSPST